MMTLATTQNLMAPGLIGVASGAFLGLLLILGFLILVRTFLVIGLPNKVLVITGPGGTKHYFGGRAWRVPGLHVVKEMSLGLMEVPITVRNGYSKGGIAMNVDAIANVKIASDSRYVGNAIERFLGRDVNEIRRVAKETLEGHLRGVIANLTPEQVNEDRLVFAESLQKETEEDLQKLGLHLDTVKILHVADEVGYLDATGRKAIANVVRTAEIAESDAKREAERTESENSGRANVTRANVDAKIAQMRNELRRAQAELTSEVKSEEERTAAAARQARAEAEQELQQVRAELEGIRLMVDKVLPAEAKREAEEYRARGEAAIIRERGRAVAEALAVLYEAWQKAGPTAMQIALIEDIEKIMAAATEGVKKVEIGSINMIDNGSGNALPNYISAYPEMLKSVFEAVNQSIGIDIPGAISGRDSAPVQEKK